MPLTSTPCRSSGNAALTRNFATPSSDYVAAVKRLPDTTTLQECVNFYLSRHPCGLPRKTVRGVLDEMLDVKANAGISEPYAKER
jgi:hypothetical protein